MIPCAAAFSCNDYPHLRYSVPQRRNTGITPAQQRRNLCAVREEEKRHASPCNSKRAPFFLHGQKAILLRSQKTSSPVLGQKAKATSSLASKKIGPLPRREPISSFAFQRYCYRMQKDCLRKPSRDFYRPKRAFTST